MKMTSAYASKMIKKLNDDKDFWKRKEQDSYSYIAAIDEEPVIPEYDYKAVSDTIADIDAKICKIKHAINVVNTTSEIEVNGKMMSIDTVLVKMAQMNSRLSMLDMMRKQQPKSRINSGIYSSRKTAPEYSYINYDLDAVKADYEKLSAEIAAMQIALDKFNQTFEFDVEI